MTEQPADAAPPEDRPATIAEFIAALGEPQNRAEERIIEQMQRLEREDARVQVLRDAPDAGTTRTVDLLLSKDQFAFWRAAMELYFAVLAFREDGDLPPSWARRGPNGDC